MTILSSLYFDLSSSLPEHGYWTDRIWKVHAQSTGSSLLSVTCSIQLLYVDDNQVIKKELREAVMKAISDVSDCAKGKKDVVKQKHSSLLETLKNIGFDNLQNIF